MDKPQTRSTAPSRDVLTLEVVKEWSGRNGSIVVYVSRPGLDGVMRRIWPLVGGIMDEPQSVDMRHWILQTVQHALWSSDGVQGVLKP